MGSPLRRNQAFVAPVFESAGDGVRMTIAGAQVVALPQGGLWLESCASLVVSDLHLEKGSSFARKGQMLPPYDTRATLARIGELVRALSPARIIALGDSFHDADGVRRLARDDRDVLRALTQGCDWIWIEGNHDPLPPQDLGGRAAAQIEIAGLKLRHEAVAHDGVGEISGHLHPCARVEGRGGAVRRRCFATDGERLVMPAFGAFTGGLNVRDEAFTPLFPKGCYALVMGAARVYPTPPERLARDA